MRFVTVIFSLIVGGFVFGNEFVNKLTQSDYVSLWSNVAVEQQQLYRIPASITLAQGILESGNGNSPLAVQANNHFGIKCSDWQGDKMYFDDDKAQECFRKYASADESYKDHSFFLTGKTRYAALFKLPIDDYKSWAKGLKSAGYATHPQYAEKLIDLIERLKLNEYDEKAADKQGSELLAQEVSKEKDQKGNSKQSLTIDATALEYRTHAVQEHTNEIKYIVARKGDTYYKISKEFKVGMWQLYRYNDFGSKKDLLEPGDIVYLEPKRMKAKDKNAVYVAKTATDLRAISQSEGIKIESLMKMNNLTSEESTVAKGQKILLR
jgi:LysM repeat protein